jgi:ElaA protein
VDLVPDTASRSSWFEVDKPAVDVRVDQTHAHLPTDARAIGRVVTAENSRGLGYSAQIIRHLIEIADSEGVATALNGQAHLEAWYARFGFERCGDTFIEDDIPHVPMVKYTSSPHS